MRAGVFVVLVLISMAAAHAEGWPNYGNDAGGTRFSSLDQIDAENVDDLEMVWQFRTGELGQNAEKGGKLTFEATPVLHGGRLYFNTGFGETFAIDAQTGQEVWRFDPELPRGANYSELTSRGVSLWEDPDARPDSHCAVRVFSGNVMGEMHALDAETGQSCRDFGRDGMVDLHRDARPREPGQYQVTSPVAVGRDRVIVGSAIGDNGAVGLARGIVRALDARTGKTIWTWDPIPIDPNDPAYKTWKTGIKETGGANAWPPLSIDVGNGLVFVPTGSPSPDFYGGERIGNGVYANSLVALSVETGEVVWYRQLVHHDVWDYDLPAQPVLIELNKDGKKISAVVQTTKMGMVFVFDRLSGEPVYSIEERPVPQDGVPGEKLSPTQPFSSLPAISSHAPITEDDAYGLFYFDKRGCRKKLAGFRSEGIYTPPTIEGTMMNPGYAGGSNWGGLAWDPESQTVIATVQELPLWIRLTPREEAEKQIAAGEFDWEGYTEMEGTPYIMNRGFIGSSIDAPCTEPPWGKIVAMDLGRGEIVWEKPLGTIEDSAPAMMPNLELGMPLAGGAIVTASGLIFVAASSDDYLRAIDLETGEELWKGRLPAGGQATPMTYEIDGRQYVVIAAGGHGAYGTTRGDYVVAFALPRD